MKPTVLRDMIIWAVAIFGILYQQLTGHVNALLLGVYLLMLGIPGAIGLVQLARGSAIDPSTHTPSSSSQLDSSSSSASSPPST